MDSILKFRKKISSPISILILLSALNLLNYIDRYIFSALLPAIKNDLHFTDTELGLLGSGFIIAYIFVSPIFGWMGDRFDRTKVMASGAALWSIATSFSGLTRSFNGQLITRFIVGLGESSYTVVSPGFLADLFSKNARGRVFAVYSGAISVGSALGYLIGGILEPRFGWQRSFFVVGIPGVLLSVLILFIQNPKRGVLDTSSTDQLQKDQTKKQFKEVTKELFCNGGFLSVVLGYAAYTFVVGGLAFWMPSYIVRYFNISLTQANLTFGGLTVAGGFFGTLVGGFISDVWEKKRGNAYLKLSAVSLLVAIPLFWLSLKAQNFNSFCFILFFLEFSLFICLSPLDTAVISFVRPEIRSMAMAWDLFLIHLLGDGISRTLIGSVSDNSDLAQALLICPWVLLLAAFIWIIGIIFFWQPANWTQRELKLPHLQSHRGFTEGTLFRENTMPAFENSRLQNFLMTELDVRLSKDRIPVVIHDQNLKRLIKVKKKVQKTLAKDLKSLVGAPSLKEVLSSDLVTSFINIEIKCNDFKYHDLVNEVLRVVVELNCANRVIISSFNPFVLRRIAHLNPEIVRAYLVSHMGWRFFVPGHILYSALAHPHMLNIEQTHLTQWRCGHFKKRKIPVVAWTVNDIERAKELLSFGVSSIISDCITPSELKALQA